MFCRTIVFQLFTKSNSLETCPLYVSVVCLLFSRQYEQNMTIFISLHELKDKVEKAIQLHTICEVQKHNPTQRFNNKGEKSCLSQLGSGQETDDTLSRGNLYRIIYEGVVKVKENQSLKQYQGIGEELTY